MRFEFKLTPGANNGLALRWPLEGRGKGIESQILDNTAERYSKLREAQYHGSLYKLQAAKRGHLKPAGEWNRQKVTVNGPEVTVELNGAVILEASLNQDVYLLEACTMVAVFVTVMILQPWLVLVVVIIGIFMTLIFIYAAPIMIQSQRMDSLYRGPLNSGM